MQPLDQTNLYLIFFLQNTYLLPSYQITNTSDAFCNDTKNVSLSIKIAFKLCHLGSWEQEQFCPRRQHVSNVEMP